MANKAANSSVYISAGPTAKLLKRLFRASAPLPGSPPPDDPGFWQHIMHIRLASLLDRDRVRGIYLSAFPEEDREAVATLAVNLLAEKTIPETFSFVAKAADIIVGHISFSPVSCIKNDKFQGYILAPLAVLPNFQKQRIGANLIETGIRHLAALGVDIVFVYGDPQYYRRFGFDVNAASQYDPPYQLQYSFGWQAKLLADLNTFPTSGKLTCVPSLRDPQLW